MVLRLWCHACRLGCLPAGLHPPLTSPDAMRLPLTLTADLLKRMLEYRAADRISAHDALQHPFFRLQL